MMPTIERTAAITLKVARMQESVRFYHGILGMEILYGGPNAVFTSLRIPHVEFPLINLQLARPATDWGRVIFHVSDVDAWWDLLKQKGFKPDYPQDAMWGER